MKSTFLRLILAIRIFKWPIICLVVLWLFALLLVGISVWQRHLLQQQHAMMDTLHHQLATPTSLANQSAAAKLLTPEETFQSILGNRTQLEEYLKTLFTIAGKQGINLPQGNYKIQQNLIAQYITYRIDLSIPGNYENIRNASEQILLALPFSALEEIKFKRENIGTNTLEAQLKFILFLHEKTSYPLLKLNNSVDKKIDSNKNFREER